MTMWQEVMQVNVNATFMLTQALLPLLLKSHAGSLVFTSSSVGRTGPRKLGCLCGVEVRHRGHDAGIGRRVQNSQFAGELHQSGWHPHQNARIRLPTRRQEQTEDPADIMPLYLYLMGEDSRRKTGMSFDAQPNRKPGAAE